MDRVVLGMAGSGRGTELHMGGYDCVHGIELRKKKIFGVEPQQLSEAGQRYGFEKTVSDFDELISDPEINLIDICTPPYTHADLVIKALKAGKNVICEKPLTGCFDPRLSKAEMLKSVRQTLAEIRKAVEESGKHFMYAENFVYAPSVQRAADLLSARKSKILFIKGEESLKGSSSPVAGQWDKTGGGTLMRVGSHPLGAALYLKQIEAQARGEQIRLDSVLCDCARITPSLNAYDHRAIAANPVDVEDTCTAILAFSDGSRCTVIANDTLLGGSRNDVELYCSDAVIRCKLTLSDLMETYLPDADGLDGFALSEMLPVKTGWNRPFVADDVLRGYVAEMQDFCEAVAYDREAKSNLQLACDVTEAMYAAYCSADADKKVFIK